MNQFLNVAPEWMTLGFVFYAGCCIGSFLNVCALRIPEERSIWRGGSKCTKCGTSIRWHDNLPIIGWFKRFGKCASCGESFSFRYCAIEIFTGSLFAYTFHIIVMNKGLFLDALFRDMVFANIVPDPAITQHGMAVPSLQTIAWMQFSAVIVLFCFLIVASLIDAEHMVIPDSITIPGAIAGLTFATILPWSRLPYWMLPAWDMARFANDFKAPKLYGYLLYSSPHPDNPVFMSWIGAAIASACFIAWCIALLPFFNLKGWSRKYSIGITLRAWKRYYIHLFVMMGVGPIIILIVWAIGGNHWQGLFSGILGLFLCGLMTWSVRIVASASLNKQALGFGDVTLMAMIGAYTGWQIFLTIFLMFAPIFAVLFALYVAIFRKENVLPFGPFLCAGTATAILYWAGLWQKLGFFYCLGFMIPIMLAFCLIMMGFMLFGIRKLGIFRSGEYEDELDEGDAEEEDGEKAIAAE